MILRALGLLAALLLLSPAVAAQTPPEPLPNLLPQPLSDTVSDFADVLDAGTEARIAQALQAQRDATGVQMVVVTMPRIEAFGATPGQRLDAYARALFDTWGVGGADRNDGILMLVVTDAREARIALGAGYDAVYDGRAARVLSTAVLPEFREGRLSAGIEAGIASVRDRLIAPFLAGLPVTVNEGFTTPAAAPTGPWLVLASIGGVIALIAGAILRNGRKRRTCPRCGEVTLTRRHEVIEPPTGLSTGTGLEHMLCQNCGFIDRRSYVVGRLGGGRSGAGSLGRSRRSGPRDGGARSSGFDGGRSSGGGASGKW